MTAIKIYGAGSVGNHIAHAARQRNWDVLLTDIDRDALKRTKELIYPQRYGAWDPQITLGNSYDMKAEPADVVFVGTPPESHIEVALNELRRQDPPSALIIEKPLCGPDLRSCVALHEQAIESETFVGVGYNHVLGKNTASLEEIVKDNVKNEVRTLTANTREHWGGIFEAHPWIETPADTYLGYSSKGGGACCEHSHALNIWQHLAHLLNRGRVKEVSALLDMRHDGIAHYDQLAALGLVTEQNLAGVVVQDVVTFPSEKSARIQWANEFAEWHVNYQPGADAVIRGDGKKEPYVETIKKARADDFINELVHIEAILAGQVTDSPISLERGLDTMMVIAAAFRSAEEDRTVTIDWSVGYKPEALNT